MSKGAGIDIGLVHRPGTHRANPASGVVFAQSLVIPVPQRVQSTVSKHHCQSSPYHILFSSRSPSQKYSQLNSSTNIYKSTFETLLSCLNAEVILTVLRDLVFLLQAEVGDYPQMVHGILSAPSDTRLISPSFCFRCILLSSVQKTLPQREDVLGAPP